MSLALLDLFMRISLFAMVGMFWLSYRTLWLMVVPLYRLLRAFFRLCMFPARRAAVAVTGAR